MGETTGFQALFRQSSVISFTAMAVSPAASTRSVLPNNFGPTLLILCGLITSPLLLGVPLVLVGITNLRDRQGQRTYGHLLPWFQPRA